MLLQNCFLGLGHEVWDTRFRDTRSDEVRGGREVPDAKHNLTSHLPYNVSTLVLFASPRGPMEKYNHEFTSPIAVIN